MNVEEYADIRTDIWAEPWEDPQLFPDCLNYVVTELGKVATGQRYVGYGGDLGALWASQILRTLRHRAASGVPFGEPDNGDLGPINPEEP